MHFDKRLLIWHYYPTCLLQEQLFWVWKALMIPWRGQHPACYIEATSENNRLVRADIWGWNVSQKTPCTYNGKQGGCFLCPFLDVVSGHARRFDIHRSPRRCSPFTSPMFTVHRASCTIHPTQCLENMLHRVYTCCWLYNTHNFWPSGCLLHRRGSCNMALLQTAITVGMGVPHGSEY